MSRKLRKPTPEEVEMLRERGEQADRGDAPALHHLLMQMDTEDELAAETGKEDEEKKS